MIISDPFYQKNAGFCNILRGVLPGKWQAAAEMSDERRFGMRISRLSVSHESYFGEDLLLAHFKVGSVSGQTGIFDAGYYLNDENGLNADWYNQCCIITRGKKQADTLSHGCISASGYGDGCYPVRIAFNSRYRIVKIEVTFIS